MDIDDILADLDDTTNIHNPPSSSYSGANSSLNTSATVLPSQGYQPYGDDGKRGSKTSNSYSQQHQNQYQQQQKQQQQQQSSHVQYRPEDDYQELITVWRNERMSPELLPYPRKLVKRVLQNIEAQIERIEFISMGYDSAEMEMESANTKKSRSKKQQLKELESTDVFDRDEEEEYGGDEYKFSRDNKLPLFCMEAELERVKFVVRSFIRCRISKIDKYLVYIRQNDAPTEHVSTMDSQQGIFADENVNGGGDHDEDDEETKNHPSRLVSSGLLSPAEYQYVIKHSEILLKYFNNTVLQHMPASLQLINDTESTVNMVDEPDMEQFVFIFVRGSPEEGSPSQFDVRIEDLNEEVTLMIGGIYVMRYDVIRDLITQGIVVLI